MSTPRILFLGAVDWANICNRIARSFNEVAGETVARVWTHGAHPTLGYREDVTGPMQTPDLIEFAKGVDWIIATGDGDYWYVDRMREKLPLPGGVRVATTHAGSAYRGTPDLYNVADTRRGFDVRFIGLDSMRFAEDDPTVHPHFSPAFAEPVGAVTLSRAPIRVAHAPSHRTTKGTAMVLSVLEALRDNGDIAFDLIEGVKFHECMDRLACCDVLVDQMEPSIGGMGALAVEAMAMGIAVVSDIRHVSPTACSRLNGLPPITQAGDAAELREAIGRFSEHLRYLDDAKKLSLEWARKNASAEATVRRWTEALVTAERREPDTSVPKISAPMIVKNEERGIRKALESLRDVVDEIVVVDTGSTDRTMEIVEEVGHEWWEGSVQRPVLKLLEHPWQDDFSEARNFAQNACTGDWCVILDGDEVLEPGDLRASIHAAADHAVCGIAVELAGIVVQYQRAHRRDRFRWSRPVHNQLVLAEGKKGARFVPSTAAISESYSKGQERVDRSIPMLLSLYGKDPSDPHAPSYLARIAMWSGKWEEGRRWAEKVIASSGDGYHATWKWWVMSVFMTEDLDAAFSAVDRAIERFPGYADLWHLKMNLCALKWRRATSPYRFQN
ncbi:MAG: glycosyltransferase, partial [Candidatus Eisenbacteria bacterium]